MRFRPEFMSERRAVSIDVRFGSKADMCSALGDVRFTPNSGHVRCTRRCPLCARRELMHCGIDHSVGGSLATSRKFGRCCRTMQVCLLSPQHQDCKNDRDEEERGHISYQMAAFRRVIEGLNAHDRPVYYA